MSFLPAGTDQVVLERLFGDDRPSKPKRERTGDETPWQVFQERFEEDADLVFDQLLDLATNGRKQIVVAGRVVEEIPDAELRLKATSMLLDRAFGKPRQQVEMSGAVAHQNVHVIVPTGEERAREVAQIMQTYGALPPPGETLEAVEPVEAVIPANGNGNGNGRKP